MAEVAAMGSERAASAPAGDDRPLVGLIGSAIPIELVEASGCRALPVLPRLEDHDRDCAPMEGEHEADTRSLFLQATAGDLDHLDLLVIGATSDGNRYVYQYLKEMVRTGRGEQIPPLYQYDLLFSDSPAVLTYNAVAFDGLAARLRALSGVEASEARLAQACLAQDEHRISLANRLSLHANGRPKILLMAMVHVGRDAIVEAVENAGAVALTLDEAGGGASVTPVAPAAPPMRDALLSFYRHHGSSSRQPADWFRARLRRAIADGCDGVIFYLPPEDQYFGWDYPALNEICRSSGVRALLLREAPVAKEALVRSVGDFVRALPGATA